MRWPALRRVLEREPLGYEAQPHRGAPIPSSSLGTATRRCAWLFTTAVTSLPVWYVKSWSKVSGEMRAWAAASEIASERDEELDRVSFSLVEPESPDRNAPSVTETSVELVDVLYPVEDQVA